MSDSARAVLCDLGLVPVLVDVGASGGIPDIWKPIAGQCRYIGFEPDARDARDISKSGFLQASLIGKALTAAPDQQETLLDGMRVESLDRMDWFKTDSHGCDLRLYRRPVALAEGLYATAT